MGMEKQEKHSKMDEFTKVKLIYSGEIAVFAIVFIVLGILFLTNVITVSDTRRLIFSWVTLFGGFIGIGDFLWVLLSPKRRKKNSLLDKILILPLGISLIGLDLWMLISQNTDNDLTRYIMGAAFCYIALIYLVEAIYHWFHPLPSLVEAAEEKPEEQPSGDDSSSK
jgi:uncharacterized membrane protein HdeD (DUF308 family)